MSIIEIFMYSATSVFLFSALVFMYYAVKNAWLVRGPMGHRYMAWGAVLFMVAITVGAVDYFFFPGSGLLWVDFSICIVGLSCTIGGGWLRAKDIQRAYRVSTYKIFTTLPNSRLYLVAIVALVFSVPIFMWGILYSLVFKFVWQYVVDVSIWAFAFVCLAGAERKFCLGLKPLTTVSRVDMRLLRKDIRILRARLDLTNSYLLNLVMISGTRLLETILAQCVEENPVLLDGYKFEFLGRLRAEPFVKNLDRINSREKEQAIFKAFCSIDAGAVVSYARLTSPKQATVMVNRSFKDGIKLHGKLLYDYVLPAMLFGNVLEPLMMKCKKGTRETMRRKIRALGKTNPLVGKLEIEHDGRVGLTSVYQALAPLTREERIKRTLSAFSTVLESARPVVQHDLGTAKTGLLIAGYTSSLLTEYPMLRPILAKLAQKARSEAIGSEG